MSAVATLAIADGQATPVTHNYIPLGPDSAGVWWFEEQAGDTAIGNSRISVSLVRPPLVTPGQNAGQRTARVKLGLWDPYLETVGTNDAGITPPPTVSFLNRFTCEYNLPERSTSAQRKDLRIKAINLQYTSSVSNLVDLLQSLY